MKAHRKQQISFHVGTQYLLRAAFFEQICSERADPTRICYLLFCFRSISTSLIGDFKENLKGFSRKTKKQVADRQCWDTLMKH